jgi:hypothetical protein
MSEIYNGGHRIMRTVGDVTYFQSLEFEIAIELVE